MGVAVAVAVVLLNKIVPMGSGVDVEVGVGGVTTVVLEEFLPSLA